MVRFARNGDKDAVRGHESNAEKALKNLVTSILSQLVIFASGIMIPRLVMVNLGSESNGLLGTVNQALVYLALLEGGMGLSVTKALYAPVANGDNEKLNGIMAAASGFFMRVGVVYCACVVALAAIFSLTLRSSLPSATVFAVVVVTAAPQAVNFLWVQKYRILIAVYGKSYFLTVLSTLFHLAGSVLKVIFLCSGCGLTEVQALFCFTQVAEMFFIVRYVRRICPWLKPGVVPRIGALEQRSAVFMHQIAGFVFNNTDMLLLTYFCGLTYASVYSVYFMLFSALKSIASAFLSSVTFAMGQKYHTDIKEYLRLHAAAETYSSVVNFSLFFVLNRCAEPFITIYTAGVSDMKYADPALTWLFTAVYLMDAVRTPYRKAIEFSGEFRATKHHAFIEAAVNLSVSLICVSIFGIHGVLIGTVAALAVRGVLMVHFASRKILMISPVGFIFKVAANLFVFSLLAVFDTACGMRSGLTSYAGISAYAAAWTMISLLAFTSAACLYDRDSMAALLKAIKNRRVGNDVTTTNDLR